ncbi:unnamed protein product [Allacma fusca]|uniref:F-box domain-containing protein n=1 Tax=Allacma fusca TaxID=39272 RepID=A0A8J2JYM4_9HEXA|nr:unnamed protein product [Allacma fusca]
MEVYKKRRIDTPTETTISEADLDSLVCYTFSIDLVLKEILKQLPVKDLLTCSLVSKNWNYSSRSVLRENKRCLAYTRRYDWCQDLRSIDRIMAQSQNLPINGLSLSIKTSDHDCIAYSNLTEAFPFLLGAFKIKYLEINWVDLMECPGVEFLKTVFRSRAFYLKGLEIFKIPCPIAMNITDFCGIEPERKLSWLPNVTTLELPYSVHACKYFLDDLLQATPKLKNLHGSIAFETLDVIQRQKRGNAIKDFDYCPADDAQIPHCLAFAENHPKLRRLNFSAYLDEKMNLYLRILEMILDSSSDSLEELDISHWNLFLLNKLEIPPLKTVYILRLGYCQAIDAQEGYSTLRKINWDRLFPNLQVLEIFDEEVREEGVKMYIDADLMDSPDFWSSSVEKFIILASSYPRPEPIFECFSQLLPNVKNVQILSCPNINSYLSLMWTTWKDIECITFYNTNDTELNGSLDAVFCGIEEDMAEELRKVHLKTLELIQLKPTRPSMLDLKKLKRFQLDILHRKTCDNTDKNNFILSKVTGALVFRNMPQVRVDIARMDCKSSWNVPCRFKLDHLSPYARFFFATGWCPFTN